MMRSHFPMDTEPDKMHARNEANEIADPGRDLVLFRKPHADGPVLFLPQDKLCLSSLRALNEKRGFVVAPFRPCPEQPVLLYLSGRQWTGWTAVLGKTEALCQSFSRRGAGDTVAPLTLKNYTKIFDRFSGALTGGVQKIVLSRPAAIPLPQGFCPVRAFRQACDTYPDLYVSLIRTREYGTWLGATPELLMAGDGKQWHTMALAGTVVAETTPSVVPSWDIKNIAEQAYVRDYIARILGQRAGSCREEGPYTAYAGKLAHLCTDFFFTLKEEKALGNFLEDLYPTPAVCGFPKAEALDFINENEGYDRGLYAGITGELYPDRTALYINLRCMHLYDKQATLYGGSGLLSGSDAESEWREILAKMKTIAAMAVEQKD